jgi:hypothetical protein
MEAVFRRRGTCALSKGSRMRAAFVFPAHFHLSSSDMLGMFDLELYFGLYALTLHVTETFGHLVSGTFSM